MVLNRRHFAIAGMACLLFGLLLPVASVPIIGTVNLLSYSLLASYLVALGIILAAVFLYLRTDHLLGDVGIGLLILVVAGVVRFEYKIISVQRHLEESLKGNPFGGLASAATAGVHLDFGVAVLLIGCVLLIVPMFMRNTDSVYPTQREESAAFGAFVGHHLAKDRAITLTILGVLLLGFAGSAYLDLSDRSSGAQSAPTDSSAETSPVVGSATDTTATAAPAPTANALSQYIRVQPLTKQFSPSDPENGNYQNRMMLTLQFHNLGSKRISAFKGLLIFTNQFGDRIQGYNVDYEESLAPGALISQTGYWDYNQFEDADQRMRSTPFSEMRFRWEPTNIIFADGSRLSASTDE